MQRLDILLGKDTYTIALDPDNMEMHCILELKAEKMYDAFVKMIEKIVPLNIALDFGIRYTQQKDLSKFTHRELQNLHMNKLETERYWANKYENNNKFWFSKTRS